VAERTAAETSAPSALAGSPRRANAFRRLLADTQRLVPIREEQVSEFTLPWPTMRRAVIRIGEALVARGVLRQADDVFFLSRAEAVDALVGRPGREIDVESRKRLRADQATLVPPPVVGRLGPILSRLWAMFPTLVGARPSDTALVSGSPASPGRATGAVRVVRGPDDFGSLLEGEVLVAPLTAPAWTPLFHRAVAVVTDVGSAAAHASIIAREYGLPAVVGCGDATVRLRTGMIVTVDGTTGNVEPPHPGSTPPAGGTSSGGGRDPGWPRQPSS
jgi:pyruvate,water dikinase